MALRSGKKPVVLGVRTVGLYMIWYINGTRFGFSLAWIAVGAFGIPLLMLALVLYRRPVQGRPLPPWAERLALLLGGLLIFVGGFETLGWAGLFFCFCA